jgi:hypothetical protein
MGALFKKTQLELVPQAGLGIGDRGGVVQAQASQTRPLPAR